MSQLDLFRKGMSLRILRWSIQFRYAEKSTKTIFSAVALLIVLGAFSWHHFGTDASLPVLADMTPILLAIVGVVMSYIQPKKESHIVTTVVLIIAGLLGSAVLSVNRIRGEKAHKTEMDQLNKKVDTTVGQNNRLSTDFSNFIQRSYSGQITEAERREGIEKILRNRYILSHDPIDPQILDGNAPLPPAWENGQLLSMGETWKVAEPKATIQSPTQIIQQITPEPKQATIAFSFWSADVGTDDILTKIVTPIPNNEVEVTLTAVNVSDVPAENVSLFIRVCTLCTWVQAPQNFIQPTPEDMTDRTLNVSEMLPNLPAGKWKIKMSRQAIPRLSGFKIGTYYACKNCPPVNWKKPQELEITEPSLPLRLLAPSISYTPGRVPK